MQKVPPPEQPPMAEEYTVRATKADQEYWKPILPHRDRLQAKTEEVPEQCPGCGSRFIEGARFCHLCGDSRLLLSRSKMILTSGRAYRSTPMIEGLASGLFAAGVLFALIAALLEWIYSPGGYEGWQAVQSWRSQWLLAAIVAFLGCLCLKPRY